jgi:hypothetical protein
MRLNKSIGIFCFSFFCVNFLFAQNSFYSLHFRNRIERSEIYMSDSVDIHSSVLPLIEFRHKGIPFHPENFQLTNKTAPYFNETDASFRLYPLVDATAGFEAGLIGGESVKYSAGLGVGFNFAKNDWIVSTKFLPYINQGDYLSDSIQTNLSIDLGTTRPIIGNLFQRNEILIAYQPHEIFTFSGGYGKHFFGEGYRSLLLSDNASNYPFLKIETAFGGIKYVNLYTVWNNNTVNPADKSLDRMKFSSLHYLSWNITKEFNLSVFESVVWQAKDTLAFRGYDINYLNPVVFYRPVEYSNGSADNVLLGINLAFKFNEHHSIYSQVILDEFLLKEIKSQNKWWGNKWGIQTGYKSNHFFAENLYFQFEFNVVRPYTYSHKYAVQNYGHLNASVTHPIGANFYELLNIISYKKDKWRFTNKITFSAYGVDTDSLNYGQNIFKSYADRAFDYGNLIMQGYRTNVLNEQILFEFPLLEKIDLFLVASYNYRMQWTTDQIYHTHFISAGIRSRIWNSYNDY